MGEWRWPLGRWVASGDLPTVSEPAFLWLHCHPDICHGHCSLPCRQGSRKKKKTAISDGATGETFPMSAYSHPRQWQRSGGESKERNALDHQWGNLLHARRTTAKKTLWESKVYSFSQSKSDTKVVVGAARLVARGARMTSAWYIFSALMLSWLRSFCC